MGIPEFILTLIGLIVVGIWGFMIISYKCGLFDNIKVEDKKKDK